MSRPLEALSPRRPLWDHLRTLPLCHVLAPDFPPEQAAAWLRGAAAAGWPLPLGLARDLGLLLTRPAERLRLAKPDYLPFDEDTGAYLAFLQRLAAHPLVRQLPHWQPPMSEAVLTVILARLVEGVDLPERYRPPAGPEGVRFIRRLGMELSRADPTRIWRETRPEQRPGWAELLTSERLAGIETRLHALDRDELRFLVRFGPPLAGAPDPRDLLDLLALTGLPDITRLALTQTLRLLPKVSGEHSVGGIQTYPEGGYEGLARQGSLDSLLPTELAYPAEVFLHRVVNKEALYYGRERPRTRQRELAYLVVQTGAGLGGDGDLLARALLLALGQTMQRRGYRVFYSYAGARLSEPRPLDKPGEVGRALHYKEQGRVDESRVLGGVLRQLRSWRADYRNRQVLWVLSEHFDADGVEEHEALYRALHAEAGQQVWYVRVGDGGRNGKPPAAQGFRRWQVLNTGLLWEGQPPLSVERSPIRAPKPRPVGPRVVVDIPDLLEMVELPGGEFLMGSPDTDDLAGNDEKPQHQVFVSGFCLGRFAVTRGLWREILGSGRSEWKRDADDDRLPANHVNWFDAVGFCNVLSERRGLRPCYRIDGENVEWDRGADGYRLPTEAEWEYSVRAGTTTRWFCGDDEELLERYAWYGEDVINSNVHPVGQKKPNLWGFYDLSGNVYEWCWDWLGDYSSEPASDPIGPDGGEYRVLRGGAFWDGARILRSAVRYRFRPRDRVVDDGFRVARAPRRQS